ncbi:MAG: hypothetical protein HRU09_10615 [Oligoflexales bacterium]|nr:hypothetical protein [Oligoflexales bacterium]
MVLKIQKTRYLRLLRGHSNAPLSMSMILKPFGFNSLAKECDHLLVGHFLDFLEEVHGNLAHFDPMDIAGAAWELGYDGAESFLDDGPGMIYDDLKYAHAR